MILISYLTAGRIYVTKKSKEKLNSRQLKLFLVSRGLYQAFNFDVAKKSTDIETKNKPYIFTIGIFACIYIAPIRDFDVQRFG